MLQGKKPRPTYQRVTELFAYDPESGRLINRFTRNPKSVKGRPAGTVNPKNGSRQVSIDKTFCYEHHIVWLIAYGHWPNKFIDHINGDPFDNRLANLRLATHRQNIRNMKRPSHNTSGFKGVTWHAGDKRWRAQIKTGGKTYFLGNFTDKRAAALAYNAAAKRMFGDYARLNPLEA